MGQINDNINKNTKILLARNSPVALIVGGASFLGSHLADRLLLQGIQVIAVDDLTQGKKENLTQAIGDKNFHLIISKAENLDLELERLDYILVIPQKDLQLKDFLDFFKKLKPRLLLVSSVELYDRRAVSTGLNWLEEIESEIARKAKEDNLNARILRLGAVYGPRMSFDFPSGAELTGSEPLIKLIQQTLAGDLQKDITLEFSSRALYIDDACDLAIKCLLAGSTAQKIFDGVLSAPIKVAEIKQVLLDPVWYESRDFSPSELPPWTTPNLEKTIKFLNWHPGTKLVSNLKKTLKYFKDHEIKVPQLEDRQWRKEEKPDGKWKMEKIGDLKGLKEGEQRISADIKAASKDTEKVKNKLPKFSFPVSKLLSLAGFTLILYALIWPLLQMGWGVLTFRYQLLGAINSLDKGEFEDSLFKVDQAKSGVMLAKSIFYSLEPIQKTGILQSQFAAAEKLANLATLSSDSAQNTILGIRSLIFSLKSVTGELNESPTDYFDQARTYLSSADEDLSKAYALINSEDFKAALPKILKPRVDSLAERLAVYSSLVKKARAVSYLLPKVVALDGSKSYLVLMQNNHELRPTGGFIGSFAKISFEGGKLKKLQVNDTYAIDGQLKIHVEPPKEIKEDLNQKDFFLRDSNWEPDFPTSARQAEWFYTKESGERVEGAVALDISAIEDLLSVIGGLDLPDYEEQITAANLFEKAVSMAEVNFFPGTQAKKSFLTALTSALFNKLFFLPNQNWSAIVQSLGRSLESKHMSIYLDDSKLFSYLISQNWAAIMPRAASASAEMPDFLAPVEANLGANKANYYLDRSYKLETTIGKDGEVSQRLRLAYINRSPSNAFPGGKYKNRIRIYLPFGSKLLRALWSEKDITADVSSFVDYGRTGYSLLLELLPKEQKTLVLDYQTPLKLNFIDNKAVYRLDVIKQAGTLKDPFAWTLTYPINLRITSDQTQQISPQEHSIQTDLSTDKTFKLEFTRP